MTVAKGGKPATHTTIHDVAAAAGISISTASKALNETGRMSPETRERVKRFGDLLDRFEDRAFGTLLLILAVPNVIPMPGLSTVVGVPMIFLGAQMALGARRPRLPRRLAAAGFERASFRAMMDRAMPRLRKVERLLHPRLPVLTSSVAERLLGLFVAVMGAVLALPIMFGNLPPAIGVALVALGLIERDGAAVLAGLIVGALSILWVAALVFGLGEAAIFLFHRLIGL